MKLTRASLPTTGESTPFVKNVFTLESCAPIAGSQVLSFKSEREMLVAWRNFVNEVDPDLVIGYNIFNFDFPYLMDRASHLKVHEFPFLGRFRSALLLSSPMYLAHVSTFLRSQV